MTEQHSLVTEEQVTEYLADGTYCPRCKCPDIEGCSVDTGGGKAMQDMWCPECGFEWCDCYTLSSIVIYSEEDSDENTQ